MMGPLTYHVGVGADGKPLVTVNSEDPEAATRAGRRVDARALAA